LNNILGLIPARGGSKGIPRKNIVPLAGRPLLAYTCEAACGSQILTRVILSTDSEEIAEIGRKFGVETPFLRPQELAQDDTPSLAVEKHAIEWLMTHEAWEAEILVLLQTTSPLRQNHHINEALGLLEETNADTVVSVVPVPHRFSPFAIMQLENGILRNFWKETLRFDRFRRQNVPVLFARNGPAILVTRVKTIRKSQSFYGQRVVPYHMNEEDSIDIDTIFDVRLAEWLIGQRKNLREGGA
jgi:CMP-N-acetylneuraminic acid synthetase